VFDAHGSKEGMTFSQINDMDIVWIGRFLKHLENLQTIILIDSCYSGDFWRAVIQKYPDFKQFTIYASSCPGKSTSSPSAITRLLSHEVYYYIKDIANEKLPSILTFEEYAKFGTTFQCCETCKRLHHIAGDQTISLNDYHLLPQNVITHKEITLNEFLKFSDSHEFWESFNLDFLMPSSVFAYPGFYLEKRRCKHPKSTILYKDQMMPRLDLHFVFAKNEELKKDLQREMEIIEQYRIDCLDSLGNSGEIFFNVYAQIKKRIGANDPMELLATEWAKSDAEIIDEFRSGKRETKRAKKVRITEFSLHTKPALRGKCELFENSVERFGKDIIINFGFISKLEDACSKYGHCHII